MNYIYDGSFEGLLTSIYEAYYRHESPNEIIDGSGGSSWVQESLIDENIYINTDAEKSDRVYRSIQEKISPESLQNVYYVYLSEHKQAGTWIYNYLKLGFKAGSQIDKYLQNKYVLNVVNMSRKVGGEVHRMLGLLRFKLLNSGVYYAVMEPDHNILQLITPHFVERLNDQSMIIHDRKRNIATLYNKYDWVITDFHIENENDLYKPKTDYEDFWRKYYKSIAIESRKNPKLQKRLMPVRYWKHLTEKTC